ncbi:fibronectin type III domain-containing protein [Viridibacillus arvi]|uniref:fibronectin type III domain-containing protein n=1 Tax=Viridibacillus arvi TaxID=263475 RepID=UPI0034CFA051
MKKQIASKWKNKKAKMITGVVLAPVAVGIVATTNMQFEASADTVFIDIHNAAELQAIKNNPKGSYRLVNDIDLTGVNWIPFAFQGALNANGFTIKNLKLDNVTGGNGLFSSISGRGSSVRELTIENFYIDSTNGINVGALAGNIDDATIENVKVLNSKVKGSYYVGLLTGSISDASIKRVMAEGTVNGSMRIGGLVGRAFGLVTFENVYTNAIVNGIGEYIGGVIGYSPGSSALKNVYSTSDVKGKQRVGGIIGGGDYRYPPTFTNVYALNTLVEGTGGTGIGNVIGDVGNAKFPTTTAREDIRGNSSNRHVKQVINRADVERGLVGFEDSTVWKQDPVTKLPIFVEQEGFPGEVPTYASKPVILTDEQGTYKPIYTVEDLKNITHNNESGLDRYKLMNDLDFEGVEWIPFVLSTQFDGNGFTIKNFKIENAKIVNPGLFTIINADGSVKNLTIKNFYIDSPNGASVGALAGYIQNATIENVKVLNSKVKGSYDVGLLSGSISDASIKRVMAEGTVNGSMRIGGLVGRAFGLVTFENVYTNAIVNGIGENIGGVIGYSPGSSALKNVYSTSDVKGKQRVGGIIGGGDYRYPPTFANVYALNTLVEGTGGTGIGNVIGDVGNAKFPTTTARKDIRGNGSNEYTKTLISQADVEKGLVGFEDPSIWKQDETTKLPIFVDQEAFPGEIPIYEPSLIPGVNEFKVTERGYNDLTLSWNIKDKDMVEGFIITRDGKEIGRVPYDSETENYSFKDQNLKNGTSYQYKVKVMFKGDVSTPVELTESTLSVEKPKVDLKKATEKSLLFTWEPVDIATGFIILRNDVEIARVTEPTFKDEGLKPSTSYNYKVITVSPYGNSQPTEITAKTSDKVDSPNPKIDASIKEKEVVVSWANFEEFYQKDISQYHVSIDKKNENGEFEQVETPMELSGKSYTFTSLEPNTEYRITVTPQIDGDYNEKHAVSKVIKTLKVEEDMPSVLNITATTSNKDVIVKWDTFEYKGVKSTRYRVQRYIKLEDGTFEKDGFARATTTNELVVTGLTAGNEYYFEVTPQVSNTYKDEFNGISNKISLELPPVEVVKPVTNVVASINEKTAEVTWDEFTIKGNTSTRYRVQVYEKDPTTGELVKKGAAVTVSENSYAYNKLEEGKSYQFMITPQANGTYNESYSNKSNEVTTDVPPIKEPEPGTVYEVRATLDGTSVILDWDKVTDVTRYKVEKYKYNAELNKYELDGYGVATTENTHVFKNLKENTDYKFVITPRIGYVYDSTSQITTTAKIASIEEIDSINNQINGVHVIMEQDKATIHWEPTVINGEEVTRYKVQRYVYNEKNKKYEVDGFGASDNSTSYVDTYHRKNPNGIYRYEVTPLYSNRYLTDWMTTVYDVNAIGLEKDEKKVFYDVTEDLDESEVVYEVQRLVLNETTGDYEVNGEPFQMKGTEFKEQEVIKGKQYRYTITSKLATEN